MSLNDDTLKRLSCDPLMAKLIDRFGPVEVVAARAPLFESLAQSIVYQQLSGKAAGTIYARFKAIYAPMRFPSAAALLATAPEALRGAGLSGQKSSYLMDLARHVQARRIPSLKRCDDMDDEAIIARLTEVKGIGRWSAQMVLIFNLGREDVLPVDDLGVRRGFQFATGAADLPTPLALAEYGARWAPFRSYAARYLWLQASQTP